MAWNKIIGQNRVKEVLRRLIETGTLPHSVLFYGPHGAGQDAAALELAKVLNCEAERASACDKCSSCRQFNELRHPRLKLIFPLPVKPGEESALEKLTPQELAEVNEQISLKAENPYYAIVISKANVIKVSSIRDIIREGAYRASGRGRTVVVVFDADKLNLNAANALLKSLEEPSGDLMFILCTANRDAILPTIRSRCQHFRFEPVAARDIMDGLRSEGIFNEERILVAAQLASGSYASGRQLAAEGSTLDRESVLAYMRTIFSNKPVDLVAFLTGITLKTERQQLGYFLSLVQFWFRDVIAIREGMPERVFNTDMLDSMQKFADHYPGADCKNAIDSIDRTIELINKNVHLMNALVVLSLKLRQAVIRKNT